MTDLNDRFHEQIRQLLADKHSYGGFVIEVTHVSEVVKRGGFFGTPWEETSLTVFYRNPNGNDAEVEIPYNLRELIALLPDAAEFLRAFDDRS
jgi:hypothetical protein